MTIRKFDLMYKLFGKAEGKCKDCKYYSAYEHHNKGYRKCEIYGVTNSEATDWKASADACGLFPDKETNIRDVVRIVRPEKKEEEQIEGQTSIFDLIEGEKI